MVQADISARSFHGGKLHLIVDGIHFQHHGKPSRQERKPSRQERNIAIKDVKMYGVLLECQVTLVIVPQFFMEALQPWVRRMPEGHVLACVIQCL